MIIKYKVVKAFTETDQTTLNNFGIRVDIGWDNFELFTNNKNFNFIRDYFNSDWNSISSREAEFSEKERLECDYLNIYADKYLGYALPDTGKEVENFEFPFDIYPYYKDVFEIKAADKKYGIIKGKQIGYYKIKGEPKWGKAKIGSLHYAEDDFFVTPDLYYAIFEPLGIKCLPVLDYKTLKPLRTILQIIHTGVSESKLAITNYYVKETENINIWNLKKVILREDVPFPLFEKKPGSSDFFYTQEYFGSGGLTQRSSIISGKLFKTLKDNKVIGLNYTPLISLKE